MANKAPAKKATTTKRPTKRVAKKVTNAALKPKRSRYTLTARLEHLWRWAVVEPAPGASDEEIIEQAQATLKRKTKEARAEAKEDPAKKDDVTLWTKGGITLANPQGRIIWSRSIK